MGNGLNSFQAMQNYHGVSALRKLADDDALPHGARTVFGGGTCLALGHRLTERYSEDIDVVLVGAGGLSDDQREEVLSAVREVLLSSEGAVDAGGRRNQHFVQQEVSYRRTLEERSFPDSRLKVRVDAGFADQLPVGDITTVDVETFLSLRGDRAFASRFRDLHPLKVRAVKPRVVLIEKMIALHQRAVVGQEAALRSRARDVFDIGCLITHEPTLDSLREPGFSAFDIDQRQMQRDQKTPTTAHRSERLQIRRPPGGFAESPVWRPGNDMHEALKQSYNSMGGLVYDKSRKPRFEDVVRRVHDVRGVL
ncbi:MAG: nucleotidyl transferase AbiEii/AbiGii toxin family protein [Acidimicrobiaceae bacterium]|nr:nucleotidyl transferase AbiEii/AbiGii toxin family protein [Acidimicrobiia bacterium]MCY4494082.1 nucleotidyl transferase AbiEii/AbiGii toxin family protein [Acidimicrobiaceae bacterium]